MSESAVVRKTLPLFVDQPDLRGDHAADYGMLYQLVADTHKRLRAFDLCRFHLVPRNVGICPASSGFMKPKPFLSSKNFIEPVGIADVPHVATCAREPAAKPALQVL
jgi:hypothetical protein